MSLSLVSVFAFMALVFVLPCLDVRIPCLVYRLTFLSYLLYGVCFPVYILNLGSDNIMIGLSISEHNIIIG